VRARSSQLVPSSWRTFHRIALSPGILGALFDGFCSPQRGFDTRLSGVRGGRSLLCGRLWGPRTLATPMTSRPAVTRGARRETRYSFAKPPRLLTTPRSRRSRSGLSPRCHPPPYTRRSTT